MTKRRRKPLRTFLLDAASFHVDGSTSVWCSSCTISHHSLFITGTCRMPGWAYL